MHLRITAGTVASNESPVERQNASLTEKLILMVLIGILGCLVVIIAQNLGSKPGVEAVASTAEAEVAPVEAIESPPPERPAPVVKLAPPPRATPVAVVMRESESYVGRERRSAARSDTIVANPNPIPVIIGAPAHRVPNDMAAVDTRRVAPGASLSGKVSLIGKPPPEKKIDFGANTSTCGALNPTGATTHHYIVSPQGGLANVLVYIKSGLENQKFPVPQEPVVINATACFYEPYMSVVQTGQKVLFHNSDPFMHNIHCTARNNREFNLVLPVQDMAQERTFEKPEVFIRIKCDVNDWMFAYLAVLSHPFAAVSDLEGNYKFPAGLPPANYVVAARHLKAGEETLALALGPSDAGPLNFKFKVPNH